MAKDASKAADAAQEPEQAPAQDTPQISQGVTAEDMRIVVNHTKAALDKQPKHRVRIRLDRDADPKAPNFETVCINGLLYQIKKGVEVEVPETVWHVLSESGLI